MIFCGKIVKPVRKKHKISNKTQLGCQMSVNHGKAWLMIRTLKSFASLKMISRKLQNQFKMWRLEHAQIFLSAAWHFDDGQVWYGAGRWPQPTGPLNYADLSQPVTLPENWSQWKGTYQPTHLQKLSRTKLMQASVQDWKLQWKVRQHVGRWYILSSSAGKDWF